MAFEINRNKILFIKNVFTLPMSLTGSYTEDEPIFPWQKNLIRKGIWRRCCGSILSLV